jgi:hypothetical protein
MDKVIIDAWERRRVREDDDAYEGRISLGPPNNVAAAYKREDQCAAVAGCSPSGRRSMGSTSPPPSPLDVIIQRGGRASIYSQRLAL